MGGPSNPRKAIIALAGVLALGLSLPLTARYVPARYPPLTAEEIVYTYMPNGLKLNDESVISAQELISFVQTDNKAHIVYGRALYPSYYEQGQYWGDENPYNLMARQYSRVQFYIIGPWRSDVFLPLSSPPDVFPHATDVIVIGCTTESGNATRALAAILNKEIVLAASPWNGLTCAETE